MKIEHFYINFDFQNDLAEKLAVEKPAVLSVL